MQVLVNTDNHITGRENLTAHVEETVTNNLRHLQTQITRVEVHLSDENSHKGGGNDKRCVMEARIEGLQPIAVSHLSDTLGQAIDGAAKKMKTTLSSTLGKLNRH